MAPVRIAAARPAVKRWRRWNSGQRREAEHARRKHLDGVRPVRDGGDGAGEGRHDEGVPSKPVVVAVCLRARRKTVAVGACDGAWHRRNDCARDDARARGHQSAGRYQSTCRESSPQARHPVAGKRKPQPGQRPRVSKVFHAQRQNSHCHDGASVGVALHRGQATRPAPARNGNAGAAGTCARCPARNQRSAQRTEPARRLIHDARWGTT